MFVDWIIKNKEILALALSALGIIVDAFLTYYIYKQTKKNLEWQLRFEKSFQEDQLDMQERQIRIDAFPYKREIYKSVFSVLQFCMLFNETAVNKKLDFASMEANEIKIYFETLEKNAMLDRQKIFFNLTEATYMFPTNISKQIDEIKVAFDKIISNYISLATFVGSFSDSNFETFKERCDKFVKTITEHCNLILGKADFIEKELSEEIKII